MKVPLGIAFILIGGLMFHVASSGAAPKNFVDVWQDILNVMGGKDLPGDVGIAGGSVSVGPIGGAGDVGIAGGTVSGSVGSPTGNVGIEA